MFEGGRGRWAAELAAAAERVPAWTRPAPTSFTGSPRGFAAWAAVEPPTESGSDDVVPDSVPPQIDAFAEGFGQGYEAGAVVLAEERATLAAERAALAELAGSLAALRPEPPADLARLLAETVRRLVTQVVGEVAIDPALVEGRAAHVAALLAEEAAPRRLRLSPADAAHLVDAALPVELVADATLGPGCLRLETAAGWVEDGPAVRLQRLRALLDQLTG